MDVLSVLFSEKRTHEKDLRQSKRSRASIRNQSGPGMEVYPEHGSHLTIDRNTGVQTDKTNYHAQETSQAREGVDLLNEDINPRY
jgi:hypothetical protein